MVFTKISEHRKNKNKDITEKVKMNPRWISLSSEKIKIQDGVR